MKLKNYLRDVYLELGKISWPKREDNLRMTYIVLGASLAVGLYIGGLDYGFTNLLGIILK